VPVLELVLLIEIGRFIGTLPTVALILITGVAGAFLARRQGGQVLSRIRTQFQTGQLPADPIFDGAIILVAAAFLMTPGVLTDALGFLCLIPASRGWMKRAIRSRIERAVRSGQVYTATYRDTSRQVEPEDVIIIDHDDYQ
jgi:UPF0716 protein FxsA